MPIPLIAAAIAAIAPGLAQKGLDLLSGAILGATDKGVEKLTEVVRQSTGIDITQPAELDNDAVERLRIWERENAAWLSYLAEVDRNDVERMRVQAADLDSARAMQNAAIASNERVTQRFLYFFATFLTGLTFVFIFWASFGHDFAANPGSERIIDTILGFLLGVALSSIVQFFFGSSLGSQRKSREMARIAADRE
jgi:hypothetical protein